MEEIKATEANAAPIAPQETVVASPEDAETKFAALEAEKAKILQERDNYKAAYLKEARKSKTEEPLDEDEEERMARVAAKVLADSRLAEIARDQDALLTKVLKENKELKLAHLNKATSAPAAALGTHSESVPVKDTLITPEQLQFFKAKGWSDKDIERYKRNLLKSGGR